MADKTIIYDLFERDFRQLPAKAKGFLAKTTAPSADEQTWLYFGYGYAAGFEELAVEVLEQWPRRDYLWLPAFFLGRHSLELAIKGTLDYLSKLSGYRPKLDGHTLLPLWHQLLKQVQAIGQETDDPWSIHCTRLIGHIHEHDPDGERFRYPASRAGAPYPFTRGDFEGLVNAHSHVTGYCDAVITAIEESAS